MKVKVKLGDKTYEADVVELGSGTYKVSVEGREFEIRIETPTTAVPTVPSVESVRIAPTTSRPTTPSPAPVPAAGGNVITAPISGKVLKVLVKPGDTVEPKTVVLTLESMKMELEVYAGRSGKVKNVLVKPGDSVRTGQPVVELE